MRKTTAVLMAASLMANLTACSGRSSSGTGDTNNSGHGSITDSLGISYKEASIAMAEDFTDIAAVDSNAANVLIFGQLKNGSWAGYTTDFTFGEYSEFRFTPQEGEEVMSAALTRFGKKAVLTCQDGSTMLYIYDSDGSPENTCDLGELLYSDAIYGDLTATPDGFLVNMNSERIAAVSSDGEYLGDVDTGNKMICGVTLDSEAAPRVLLRDLKGKMYIAGVEGTDLADEQECAGDLNNSPTALCAGRGDYRIVGAFSSGIYGLSAETNKWVQFSDMLDNTFNRFSVYQLVMTPEGELAACSWDEAGVQMVLLTERDIAELKSRTTITIAGLTRGDNSDLMTQCKRFNSSQDEYHAEFRDYTTEGEPEDWYENLKMDMISGNAPDIIPANDDISPDRFGARDSLFLDLYQFIDSDPELNREDFVPGFLDSISTNGKLLSICPAFVIETLTVKDKFLGGMKDWDIRRFADFVNNRPADTKLFDLENHMRRSEILLYNCGYESFIDFKNGTCDFENPDFILLMETLQENRLGMGEEEWRNFEGGVFGFDQLQYRSDKTLICQNGINNTMSFAEMLHAVFDEPSTNIGYPTSKGSMSYMSPVYGWAVMANTESPEGAWAFIRQMFDEELYERNGKYYYYFPALKKYLEPMLDKTLTDEVIYTDPDTGEEYYKNMYTVSAETGEYIRYEPLTEEELDRCREFLYTAVQHPVKHDIEALYIVREELEYYFNGEHTAQETAAVIQDRVSIYLSEHYQ